MSSKRRENALEKLLASGVRSRASFRDDLYERLIALNDKVDTGTEHRRFVLLDEDDLELLAAAEGEQVLPPE